MKILNRQLKPLFVEAIKAAYPDLNEVEILNLVSVEDPRDAGHGDYACPAPFKLAKILGEKPQDIGAAIVENFPEDYRVGSVEFAEPGFINLRLSVAFLEEELKLLEHGFGIEGVQTDSIVERKKPVIMEYNSANAAKPMGVHHIITTVLGDALANLYDFMGYEVIRINHLGDWGTNFGKIIYAVETWGDEAAIHENPNDELSKLYVKFNTEAEKNPELDEEARKIFRDLEMGDELRTAVWEWIVNESISDLKRVFSRLGIQFDHITGESFYRKMAEQVIEDGVKKGLFAEGENGALIFEMGENQVPALIRKSDGTTLYLTRDVATIKYRVETWHPEAIFYVVDHAQSLHFKQNFEIAKALGYADETNLEHISFGRMSFADRAMSTRKGNVIKLEDLLDEAAKKAGDLAIERGTEFPREELAALMEGVGVASVKYGILSQDRNRDIIFDWEKIISLDGNAAPYLLYSYARAFSIVHKAGAVTLGGMPKLTEELEIEIMRMMVKLPEVLERAMEDRKPHIISTFLYELCQEFNRFYGGVRVLGAENEDAMRTRMGIILSFMHQLKTGLSILGIPVLERM